MAQLTEGVDRYFQFYTSRRFHQSLDYRTPDEMYQSFVSENKLHVGSMNKYNEGENSLN